jgi:hypothetical protein
MLAAMKNLERRFVVDGVAVTLVRNEAGARWLCEDCGEDCAHVLQAATWMTLESWAGAEQTELH